MKKNFFLKALAAMLILVPVLYGCSKKDAASPSSNKETIYMKNAVFSNTNLQVLGGTTVTWVNDDTQVHTVTADDGSFDSGDLQPGQSFQFSFTVIGPHAYHCMHHSSMTGLVTVIGTR